MEKIPEVKILIYLRGRDSFIEYFNDGKLVKKVERWEMSDSFFCYFHQFIGMCLGILKTN